MSFGGGKTKPEDLFSSLQVIKKETSASGKSVSDKFVERFKGKFSENPEFLKGG